jgi:hypothetical protein
MTTVELTLEMPDDLVQADAASAGRGRRLALS